MAQTADTLEILVVDDDKEVLAQLAKLLPKSIGIHPIKWEYCDSFDVALELLRLRRFDLLVSDIYLDRKKEQKDAAHGDARVRNLVTEIRSSRFCPIVLFTDGKVPDDLLGPFVWSADKARPEDLHGRIGDAVETALPAIARRLHDELDRFAGSYLWGFLASRWDEMRSKHALDPAALERVIRRRAAIQLGRMDQSSGGERELADPADFYIYPGIGRSFRLGEIVRRKGGSEFRVVLTPHCFLVTQPGESAPRASYVFTARTVSAAEVGSSWKWDKNASAASDELRRRTGFPASKVGLPPDGRYCFLPGFLDIPDLYCDLLQLESIAYNELVNGFDRIAVLDGPYAEALQACIARLYGTVGVPVLNPDSVKHLRG